MTAEPGRGEGPVVTLDGPAGSGKSTTARGVAQRLGYRHLDSGSLYRALTYSLLEKGVPPEAWSDLDRGDLDRFRISLEPTGGGFRIFLDGRPVPDRELRTPRVTSAVSRLATLPPVRTWLLTTQRRAGSFGGVVADGRDMGTVVFPHAEVKVFLTAALEERARRRLVQDGTPEPDRNELAAEVRRLDDRDRRDTERKASPLKVPDDAVVLDTTHMTLQEQVNVIVELVRDTVGS